MARIILTSVGQDSDVLPFLHLARHLVTLGHEPTVITNHRYVEVVGVASIAAAAVDNPEDWELLRQDLALLNDPLSLPTFFRRHYLPAVPRECDLIRSFIVPGATVLVANEIPGIAARLMSQTYRIPLVSVFTNPDQLAATRLYPELFHLILSEEVNFMLNREGWIGREDLRSWWLWPRDGIALWTAAKPIDCWPCRAVPVGAIDPVTPNPAAVAKAASVIESVLRRAGRPRS